MVTWKFYYLLSTNGTEKEYEHGVVIVAVGEKKVPERNTFTQNPRVLTQRELEEKIVHHPQEIEASKRVVMIQCVGSELPDRPYCSRICCSLAVKNALKIKAKNPGAEITIPLSRHTNLRINGAVYTEARKQGISFIPYDLDSKPDLRVEDHLLIWKVKDKILGEEVTLRPDLLFWQAPLLLMRIRNLAKMLQSPIEFERFLS